MRSTPSTPSSEPPTKKQCRFKDTGLPTEWAEDYRPGGFHPVHFGDKLKEGQYKIIRKLGDGSFSTVWLAVDEKNSKYVALKILRSSSSTISTELSICYFLSEHSKGDPLARYVTWLLDAFEITGPNGSHWCLIFEPMGPSVISMVDHLPKDQTRKFYQSPLYPKDIVKKILKHAISGLSFLHQHGIVHGDVQGGNMLFYIPGLDSVDEQQLRHDHSKISKPLVRRDGKTDRWGPKYLASPQTLHGYVDLESNLLVKLSDMGSAFWKQRPPQSTVTPVALRAPELIFRESFGEEIDIWAIGCLIYELLTGSPLFGVVLMGDDTLEEANDDHILDLIDVLGPLPEYLMSKWPRKDKWIGKAGERLNPDDRGDGYQSGSDGHPDSESETSELSDEEDLEEDPQEAIEEPDEIKSGRDALDPVPSSPPEIDGLSSAFEVPDGPFTAPLLEEQFKRNKPSGMDAKEMKQVTDLIRGILQYDPTQRPTAAQLLQHPWFQES